MRLFKRHVEEHKITVIAEFINDKKSLIIIGRLSDYISKISDTAMIITDLQSYPAGYRITYTILYQQCFYFLRKRRNRQQNKYTIYLSKLSNWIYNDNDSLSYISRYHYNHI